MSRSRALRWALVGVAALASAGALYVVAQLVSLNSTWNSIERVPLAADTPRTSLEAPTETARTYPEAHTDTARTSPEVTTDTAVETVREGDAATESGDRPDPTPSPPEVPPASTSTTSSPAPDTSAAITTTTSPPASTTTTEPSPTTTGSTTSTVEAEDGERNTIVEQAEEPPRVLAIVGSDSRAGLDDLSDFGDFAGKRADTIMLAVRSEGDVHLVSVPRDLYVEDLCDGGRHRIGEAFAGCGDQHGLTTLVQELEHVAGYDVEHAVAADLSGFQSVIDTLGGYEICTDYPLRDEKSGLRLDSGCVMADGETTLQWVRSRYTERYVDGQWETLPGVSDLTRNERQRQLVMDLFGRIADRPGPGQIKDALEAAAPHLTIDDELTLADVAAWAWQLRDADLESVEIPVRGHTTPGGAAVLVPTVDVPAFLRDLS